MNFGISEFLKLTLQKCEMFDEIYLIFFIRSGAEVHLLGTHICAAPTRRVHLLFSISRRPRCIAAVCWFLLRGCVFRPDDDCQERFSWFSYWIQKVQKFANLVDLVKGFPTSIYLQRFVSLQPRTSLSKFAKNSPEVRKKLETSQKRTRAVSATP